MSHAVSPGVKSEILSYYRQYLQENLQRQAAYFDAHLQTTELVRGRSNLLDRVLTGVWREVPALANVTLVAVGGYGRQEMFPYSDVDLLILVQEGVCDEGAVGVFLTALWDIGLDVAHSVRTLDECHQEALADVTIATNILEGRWLAGDYEKYERLMNFWRHKNFWPSKDFYLAKIKEQEERYKRYQSAPNLVEPNLKESPGGLRDLHILSWVTKRHFNLSKLSELLTKNYMTIWEMRQLLDAQQFIWKVRFLLHLIAKRKDERLLFDRQQEISQRLGYVDKNNKLAVEWFMQDYYHHARHLMLANETVLQQFREDFVDPQGEEVSFNRRFNLINGYLTFKSPQVLEYNPSTIFEIALILQQNPKVKGVRADAIRLIRERVRDLVDDEFRQSVANRALFIAILSHPRGINAQLRRLHRYGVLMRYIPEFGQITNLMQFDLFHLYTVDEHTLMVVRNLRRFFLKRYASEFPTAHNVAMGLRSPVVLLIAGFFHDIAKGQGGEHEVKGALVVERFARMHALREADVSLARWLVRYHLVMSQIAQKEDITDPEVVQNFANICQTQEQLDYLYLLTLADIRGTNPQLWNSWKDYLLLTLYQSASAILRHTEFLDQEIHQQSKCSKAKVALADLGIAPEAYAQLWQDLGTTDYFRAQQVEDLVRHVELQHHHPEQRVFITSDTHKGASEVIIFHPDQRFLFYSTTHALERLGFNILSANIFTSKAGLAVLQIYCYNRNNQLVAEMDIAHYLEQINKTLGQGDLPKNAASPSRQVRQLLVTSEVRVRQVDALSEIHLTAADQPGLLSRAALAFVEGDIRLHAARINTYGERVEDTFKVSTSDNQPLDDAQVKQLSQRLEELLNG